MSPQGVFCRKKSPLYTCDQQYGWINGICLLREYSNSTFRLTRCLAAIANCDACFPSSDTMCASCKTGFFNVNNTCISTCPADTIEFEGITCIFPEVTNCSIPYLKLDYQAVVINYVRIQNSDPYSHYTFNGKATSNDPVGYIPIFQQLTERKDDGLFRDTEFISPSWTCLKCADGLGLSSDFLSCVPCPAACLTCYMALDTSCLTVFNPDCQYYIDS